MSDSTRIPAPSRDGTRPATVLVVEDDPAMLSLLVTRLQSRGHRCIATAHGTAAMAAIRHSDFDVLVTDLDLPGVDGVELAGKTRRAGDAPIVVLTGRREAFADRVRDLAGVTLLEKPCPTAALAGVVETEPARNRGD